MKFFDDNTRSWWTPITGGANVPALNDLLAPHNITLGERILQGTASLGEHKVTVSARPRVAAALAAGEVVPLMTMCERLSGCLLCKCDEQYRPPTHSMTLWCVLRHNTTNRHVLPYWCSVLCCDTTQHATPVGQVMPTCCLLACESH